MYRSRRRSRRYSRGLTSLTELRQTPDRRVRELLQFRFKRQSGFCARTLGQGVVLAWVWHNSRAHQNQAPGLSDAKSDTSRHAPSAELLKVLCSRATLKAFFSGCMEQARTRVVLWLGRVTRQSGEGRMSFIIAIMSVPFLTATGIYNPQVMHHGRCVAEPGSFAALYCPAPEAPPHRRRYGKKN